MNNDLSRQSPSVLTSPAGSPRSPQSDGAATSLPWTLGHTDGIGLRGVLFVRDSAGRVVANCEAERDPNKSLVFVRPFKEDKANAELIVKAVNSHAELLAALKAMVACCTNSEGAVSPEPHDRGEWLDNMLNARAAIARAEGRA